MDCRYKAPPLPPAEVQHGDVHTLPPLYVITVISNPIRFNSRTQLYKEFVKRTEDAGAVLYTVELAFGDRPYAVTERGNPYHLQFRTTFELWHKENMINLGLSRLPEDWKYVAWVDADVAFTNPHWVNETIQQLQHYKVVQMFTYAIDQGPDYQAFANHRGFVYGWTLDPTKEPNAGPKTEPHYYGGAAVGQGSMYHPGYAWAARRDALDGLGGLIDWAVLGSADYHMARALVGYAAGSVHPSLTQAYKDSVLDWESRCNRVVQKNVGYVDSTVIHYWHGKKGDRKYWDRNKILAENQFNPHFDVMKDTRGVLSLPGNKNALRDGIMAYMRARNEDSIDM